MPENSVRILHLSDFHFRPETTWDSSPLVASLPKAIAELVGQGLAPDLVAITGDIAHGGKKAEYDLARDWINDQLLAVLPEGFEKTQVLLVPGNHDVNREAVKDAAQSLQDRLLQKKSQKQIAAILEDSGERGVLLKRHAAYLRFANQYRPPKQKLKVPWWSTVREINGCRVHLAGLCSSWMSWCDEDQGKLLISRWQVNTLFNDAPDDADFRVVLVHHPWDDLIRFDREEIRKTVRREAHLVLRGHLHAQESDTVYDPDDSILELTAGSVYKDSEHANAFQLIELCPGDRSVRVHYRIWRKGGWRPDRHAYENAPDGVATFSLAKHPATPADPTAYLEHLRDQSQYIDIRGLHVGSGEVRRFEIDRLYIPLAAASAGAERSDRKARKDHPEELDPHRAELLDLSKALEHRCLVILGDPGAGKTTFLRRIAFELCRKRLQATVAKPDPHPVAPPPSGVDEIPQPGAAGLHWETLGDAFPLLIPLAALARHQTTAREQKIGPLGDDVPEWLVHWAATHSRETGDGLDEAFFRAVLQRGPALVLLDGLDEVPSAQERLVLRTLIENAARSYQKCRFVVTTRPAAFVGDTVLAGFDQARIAPLGDEAIETFLDRWCHALWPDSAAEAQRHLGELLRSLKDRPEIRRMARNPVMLTALAVVHWQERRLPEQRAELYDSIIGWLAKSRQYRIGRPKPEQCIALLQNLALAMQDHPKGRQTQVSRHWGARAVASFFREVDEDERAAAAEAFLAQEEVDSGIIVGRGERDLRFWHLTFQEYLAARALAARLEKKQTQRLLSTAKLYQPEWREVVLLMAGVLHRQDIEPVDAMFKTVLDQVRPKAELSKKARCAGLLSAILRDLAPVGYKPEDRRYEAIVRDSLAVFDARRSQGIAIEVALEAAEAIGQGGDPRFTDPKSAENWVTIPRGDFLMGAQRKDSSAPNYDAKAYGEESPVHKVHLNPYRIGKYPVTVGEYKRFVDHDGYTKKEHWESGGFGKWEQPENWDEQLAHLNRPVGWVSWYEVAAYAAWADARLPTEAEWERAARGTRARRYPWGDDDPDPSLLNYMGNIGHPTPVGVYPRGATPDGVLDLPGNVWEWCDDWYGKYPSETQVDPRGPKSASSRVLRGGSWDYVPWNCRAAFRLRNTPDYRNGNIGFRIASGT